MSGWYDNLYADDPAAGNVFGREALAERNNPVLLAFLKAGGRFADFPRAERTSNVIDMIDRAISIPGACK